MFTLQYHQVHLIFQAGRDFFLKMFFKAQTAWDHILNDQTFLLKIDENQ